MYEVKMNTRCFMDGDVLTTWSRDVVDHNILKAEAGTQGHLCKGAHGGKTFIAIRDQCCTNMKVQVDKDRFGRCQGFEMVLEGRAELDTLIQALKFITHVLEEERKDEKI